MVPERVGRHGHACTRTHGRSGQAEAMYVISEICKNCIFTIPPLSRFDVLSFVPSSVASFKKKKILMDSFERGVIDINTES
jgi:hypothetical protein